MFSLLPDVLSSKSPPVISPRLQRGYSKIYSKDEDEKGASSPVRPTESAACNCHTFIMSPLLVPAFLGLFATFSLHSNQIQTFSAAEGCIRGRSYNIKLDDQVLLRFSPKKSDSNYYFSDMVKLQGSIVIYLRLCSVQILTYRLTLWLQIGGTLTFFHEERTRRCLEVIILHKWKHNEY